MITNSHLTGIMILNEKVKDVLLLKLPDFFYPEIELSISSLEGKIVIKQILSNVYESLIKVKTESLEKGTYIIQMASKGKFIAKSFEKE